MGNMQTSRDTDRDSENTSIMCNDSEHASSMPGPKMMGTRKYIGDTKDPDIQCSDAEWDFLRYCQLGDLDQVKKMTEENCESVNVDIPMFATPLGLALSSRSFDVATYLLSKGARLSDQFHQFANSGDLMALCWLFAHGGSPSDITQCVALAYSNSHHDLAYLFRSLGGRDVKKSYVDLMGNGTFSESYA